jgi:hypothetical protein
LRAPIRSAPTNYIAGEGDGDAVGEASASELFFFELFLLEDELDEDDDFFSLLFFSAELLVEPVFAAELLEDEVVVATSSARFVQETNNVSVVRRATEERINFFIGGV